jgi:hypothetical protein|nr:MAG TPA: hypothetical protein [Caudoviricetes sp.]
MSKTEIVLANGQTVSASLGFAALKNLRHKNSSLYKFADKAIAKGIESISEASRLLYAAYLAVNEGEPIAEGDFYELLPDSYAEQVEMLQEILQ